MRPTTRPPRWPNTCPGRPSQLWARRGRCDTVRSLCINSSGKIYDKEECLLAVISLQLTYSADVDLTETDRRIDGDIVIIAGEMLGHACLDGEPQVYRLRSMRIWRRRESGWKLLAWQASTLLRSLV